MYVCMHACHKIRVWNASSKPLLYNFISTALLIDNITLKRISNWPFSFCYNSGKAVGKNTNNQM